MSLFAIRYHAPPAGSSLFGLFGLYVLVIVVTVLFGTLFALGSRPLTILAFGLVGAVGLLFASVGVVLIALTVLTFLLIGPLGYFGGLHQAQWAPFLIAGTLFLRVPIEIIRNRTSSDLQANADAWGMVVFWSLGAYLFFIVASALLNNVRFLQLLVGAKNYLFFWAVFLLISVGTASPRLLTRIWYLLMGVALVQLPFAVYQHFFVSKQRQAAREGLTALDAVVGSFGGNPDAGGGSGSMALFLIVVLSFAGAMWRARAITGRLMLILFTAVGATIVLAEVKVAVVLLPFAFFVLFRGELRRRPLFFVGASAMLFALLFVVVSVYQGYWAYERTKTYSLSERIERSYAYFTDPNYVDRYTGEVGRVASLVLWARENTDDPGRFLLGNGLGASRTSTVAMGEQAVRHFPYRIDANSVAALLWDVGLLGALAFVLAISACAVLAFRISKSHHLSDRDRAMLEAAGVGLILVLCTLPYNRDAVDTPQIELLLMLLMGYVVFWRRQLFRAPAGAVSNARAG